MLCACSLPWDVNLHNSRGCSFINCCHTPHVFFHWWTPKSGVFHLAFGWTHQPRWHGDILSTAEQFYGKFFQRPREENCINGWSPFSLDKSLSIALNPNPPCHNLFLLFLHLLINSHIKSISCSLHFFLKLDQTEVLYFKRIFSLWQLEKRFHLPATELESSSCLGHRDQLGSPPDLSAHWIKNHTIPNTYLLALKSKTVLVYFVAFKQRYVLS